MVKRRSYDIKKKLLLTLKEAPASYAQLERKLNTGYRTVKANCEEMQVWNHVKISTLTHPANGKRAHKVEITKEGKAVSQRL
ncbi:MAG: hypothetical protein OXR66_03930 [Candidatus Woesearchaeota archaeon]|nr:hypothetical protein [Candidatus Woesearchaeota archaeon]